MTDALVIDHYLQLAEPYLNRYGLGALFGIVMVEGIGIPAPGQSLLIAAALLASQGQLPLVPVLVIAWAAAVCGDNIGYQIGSQGGHRLALRIGVRRSHLRRVHGFFERFGGGVVTFARFIDGLRQLNGVVAGTAGMPWSRFFAFDVIGATLWTAVWGYGAYRLGRHLDAALVWFKHFEPWIAAAGLVGVAGLLIYLVYGRNKGEQPS